MIKVFKNTFELPTKLDLMRLSWGQLPGEETERLSGEGGKARGRLVRSKVRTG